MSDEVQVIVHPKEEWPPGTRVGSGGAYGPCPVVLHTTQGKVMAEVVAQKRALIEAEGGFKPAVSVVPVGDQHWVFDGHHALAAYRELGLEPRCFLYKRGGPDVVVAPRLKARRGSTIRPINEKLGVIETAVVVAGVVAADVVIPGPISGLVLPTLLGDSPGKRRRSRPTCAHPDGATTAQSANPEESRPEAIPKPGSLGWTVLMRQVRKGLADHKLHLGESIGRGKWGETFLVSGKRVVKITSDASEAASAWKVLRAVSSRKSSWEKLDALVRFQCVYGLLNDDHEPTGLYAIVMERLHGKIASAKSRDFLLEVNVRSFLKETEPEWRARAEVAGADPDEFVRLAYTIQELHRLGIPWTDLHDDNVLLGPHKHWRIIDIGFIHGDATPVKLPALDEAVVEKLPAAADRVKLPKLESFGPTLDGAFEDEARALVDWFKAACSPAGAPLDQAHIAQVIRLLQDHRQVLEDHNAKEMKKPSKDPLGHYYNERDTASIKSNRAEIKDCNVWLRKLEKYVPAVEKLPTDNFEDRVSGIADAVELAEQLHSTLAADTDLHEPAKLAGWLRDALRNAESCEGAADFNANLTEARRAAALLPDLLKAARKGAEPHTLEALGDAKDTLRDLVRDLKEAMQDVPQVEKLSTIEMMLIAGDMAIPDPVPGTPGFITAAVLANAAAREGGGRQHAWLPVGECEPAIPMMKHAGEGHRFLLAYRRAAGDPEPMEQWHHARQAHLAQLLAHGEKLWDADGDPTPRALAMVQWAYHPEHAKWRAWLHRHGVDC